MRRVLTWLFLGTFHFTALGKEPGKSSAAEPKPAAGPVKAIPVPAPRKLETYLLLPEPRAMRTAHFAQVGGSLKTIFSPAREVAGPAGIELYTEAEFAKLGIGMDAFEKKAREGAERLLGVYRPELIQDQTGKVRYAVYRGEQQVFACLLMAPSLGKVFEGVFGKKIIVAMPDRNSLYVFPSDPAAVDDFAGDLESRYETSPWAASDEVFLVDSEDQTIKVLGSFASK